MPACNHGCFQNCCITFQKCHGFSESWDNNKAQGCKGRKILMISLSRSVCWLLKKPICKHLLFKQYGCTLCSCKCCLFCRNCCVSCTLCNVCRQYKPWLSMVTATTQLSCCKPYVVTYKMSRGVTHSCSKGSTLGMQSHMSAGVWHLHPNCPFQGQWTKRPLLAPPCSEVCAPSRLSSAHQLLHHSLYVCCVQAQRMLKSLHCVCLSGHTNLGEVISAASKCVVDTFKRNYFRKLRWSIYVESC